MVILINAKRKEVKQMQGTVTITAKAGDAEFKIEYPNIKVARELKSQLEKQGLTVKAEIVKVIV